MLIPQDIKTPNRQQNQKQGKIDLQNNQKTIDKMVIVSPYLIITLSINRLNYSIKRQEWLNETKQNKTNYPNYLMPTID